MSSVSKKSKILIAEDNMINQLIVCKLLENWGHEYHAVSDGQAALDALASDEYSLLILDCQMPVMDGYECAEKIRSNFAASYNQIPIIALTANSVVSDRERCLKLGMNDYLTKPIHADELKARIASLIQRKAAA